MFHQLHKDWVQFREYFADVLIPALKIDLSNNTSFLAIYTKDILLEQFVDSNFILREGELVFNNTIAVNDGDIPHVM